MAHGLLEFCQERLEPAMRRSLMDVTSGRLRDESARGLPRRLEDAIDLTACTPDQRRALEMAYAQVVRDARLWITPAARIPEMRGGVGIDAHPVVLTATGDGMLRHRGVVIADSDTRSLPALRESAGSVLLVTDEWTPWEIARWALGGAHAAGHESLGIVVKHDADVRVLPVVPAESLDGVDLLVRMDYDGFWFSLPTDLDPDGDGLVPTGRGARPQPDIPLAKPGMPLDEITRWDLDGLDAEIRRRLARARSRHGTAERPTALVIFDPETPMNAVTAVLERVRGPDCTNEGGDGCRVARVRRVF